MNKYYTFYERNISQLEGGNKAINNNERFLVYLFCTSH